MGYTKPVVCEIAYHTYAINEFGMATCFLVLGSEKALLIDAGCGMYNMKELVDELTDLPVELVLTHGHGDHIGCAGLFETVYCHPADQEDVLHPDTGMLGHYPEMMAAFGSFDTYDIRKEDIHFYGSITRVLPVKEGDVFDLGGRKLYVLETPGHTPGSIVLIDPESKILFSGDACNPNLGVMSTSVETTLKGLRKIKAHEADFNRNYNGHIGYGGTNVNIAMPENNLDDDILICEHLLAGDFDRYGVIESGDWGGRTVSHSDYHGMRINFDPARLWEKDMEQAK